MVNRKRADSGGSKATYRRAMNEAYKDLSGLLERRESLLEELETVKWKIDDLQSAVEGMGKLCGIDPEKERPELFPDTAPPDLGFTDAVREVFLNADAPVILDPMSVRDKLVEMKFPLSKYKAPLASLHTILKRLHAQDELEKFDLDEYVGYRATKKLKKRE